MQSLAKGVREVSIRAEEGVEEAVQEGMPGMAAAYKQDPVDRDGQRGIVANLLPINTPNASPPISRTSSRNLCCALAFCASTRSSSSFARASTFSLWACLLRLSNSWERQLAIRPSTPSSAPSITYAVSSITGRLHLQVCLAVPFALDIYSFARVLPAGGPLI